MRRSGSVASCWFTAVLVATITGPVQVAAPRSDVDPLVAATPGATSMQTQPPSPQPSSGVPGVSFDLVVVDRAGRLADNLRPSDLTVSVDGRPRRVLSMRRVSRGPGALSDAAARSARGNGTLFFAAEPGRNVLVIVDQATLVRGDERGVIAAGNAFLDRLGMADRVAVVLLPLASSQLLSLTTEQPAARQALARVTGQSFQSVQARPDERAADPDRQRLAAVDPTRERIADPDALPPPVTAVGPDVGRGPSHGNLAGLADVLQAMRSVPGRKIVALFSAGVSDSSSAQVADVAAAAAAARAAIYAFGMLRPREDTSAVPELGPLESLARTTGGGYTLLDRNRERAIGRTVAELAACYVVEIEAAGINRDGKQHPLRVDLADRSLMARAPAWLVPTPDPGDVLPGGPEPVPVGDLSPVPAAGESRPAIKPAAIAERDVELQVAMGRLIDYVEAYERQYSGLVAEEDYLQRATGTSVRLRSDYLLVKPEHSDEWVSFRDVFEADGVAVRDREDRLKRLFLEPGVRAQTQLMAIKDESARYNIGSVERNINVPLFTLRFLAPANRPRFRFKTAGRRQSGGVDVWRIEFEEQARPTIVTDRADHDLPSRGWFLVDQISGAIVESGLKIDEQGVSSEIVVTFRRDPALGMWVPTKMKETYRAARRSTVSGLPRYESFIEGTATYSKFRRFQVTTEEKITIPK